MATDPGLFKKTGGKHTWPVEDVTLTKDQVFVGATQIKRAGVILDLSEDHIKEFIKCKKDPVYFLKTYGRVVHVDKGLVPLKLYKYQEKMIRNFQNNRFSICLTCRQAGKTTAVVGFLAWYSIFHSEKDCHVLANKESQSMEIMKRLRRLIEELPYFLQSGAVAFNKGNIAFENGSGVAGHSSSSSAIRGISAALLYIDEFAFLQNDLDFWDSTYSTVSSGTTSKILITSTPKGARGVFHSIWKGAVAKGDQWNGFMPLQALWYDVPGRDENWKKKTIAAIGPSRFSQEHECEFLGSSGTLIQSPIIAAMQLLNPIHEFDGGAYQILRPVDPDRVYVATADCAEGTENDYSVTTIFDVTEKPYRIAAKYRCNKVSPLVYPYEIERICRQYNDAWVLVENNSIGAQILQILYYEIEYENVFLTSSKKNGLGTQVGGAGAKPGVRTTTTTKSLGCSNLKTLVETQMLLIEDADIIEELGRFVIQPNGPYEADEGCHDDTVSTLWLFAWLARTDWFKDVYETDDDSIQDRLKRMRESRLDDSMTTFFSTKSMEREEEEEAPKSLYDFMTEDNGPGFEDDRYSSWN